MLDSLNTTTTTTSPTGVMPTTKLTAAEMHMQSKQNAKKLVMNDAAFVNQDSFLPFPPPKNGPGAHSIPFPVSLPTEAELRGGASALQSSLLSGVGEIETLQATARREMLNARNHGKKQNKTQKKKAAKAAMYGEKKVVRVVKRDGHAEKRRRVKDR